MNHTVYRHLSIPCPVMRGSLRVMPESSRSSRWSGTPGTGRRRWWSGRCGTDCWMTSDTDPPPYTFIEPSVGYRMEKGEPKEEVG